MEEKENFNEEEKENSEENSNKNIEEEEIEEEYNEEEKKNIKKNFNVKTFDLHSYPVFGTEFESKHNNKYFIDFSKFQDKIKKILNNCFISYNISNKNYFLINIKDNGISLKFLIDISSIEKIIYGNKIINEDNSIIQTIYFYLKYVPKIYIIKNEKKDNNNDNLINSNENEKSILNFLKSEFYFNIFKKKLNEFSFSTHYHNEDKNKIIKKSKETNNISFKPFDSLKNDDEDLQKVFIDSLLSKSNEFLNFYLLNLILKLKIKFKKENDCFNFLIKDFNLNSLISKEEKFISLIQEMNKRIINYLKNAQLSYFQLLYNLDFSLQYSILSLITNKRINIFNTNLIYLINYCSNFNCESQEKISKIIDKINVDSTIKLKNKFFDFFEKKISENLKNEKNSILENNIIEESLNYTKTIEITPSIIIYNPPKLERTNQLIRLFNKIPNHFLKIKFVTEDKKLFYFASETANRYLNFLNSLMINGLYVGSYYFQFLTSSNNQSKEASGWYMNIEESGFNNINEVNIKFGDFSQEKNIFKNAFRRGQIASTSTSIMNLKKENLILINDILSDDNKYNYTDGIGQISPSLANKINMKMKKKYFFQCSAYQIRIGGIKGIVAINPNLKGEYICYRPSMEKYKSNVMELGVIKTSKFSQGYLNSQIIILLCTLGVDKNIIINMMKNEIEKYDNLINGIKEQGNNLLDVYKENEEVLNDIFDNVYYLNPLINMYKNTENFLKEPLIKEIIYNIISSKIKKLKLERKIIDKKSAYLLGVADETNTLKSNEVFIHIEKINKYNNNFIEEDIILEGDILITKNPCLHPGDLRIVKSINNNEINNKLKHMKNVVVFSSEKGKRPIQNMISGGDLDGDCFFISWNKNLIDNIKIRNFEALEDFKNNCNNLSNDNSLNSTNIMDNIIEAKIKSTKCFIIPKISSLHISIADNDVEKYAFNEKCIKLSKLFSIAIDSEKTGIFISQNELNEFNLKKFPDFLNLNSINFYQSPGILGIIFRMCDFEKYKQIYENNINDISFECNYEIDLNLISDNCINYVKKCYEIYKDFCKDINNIILKFEFKNECELFTNENIYLVKNNKNKNSELHFHELNFIQKKYLKILKDIYKEINEDIASACYLVTYYYKNNKQKLNNDLKNKMDDIYNHEINHYKFFSFPWILKDVRDKLKFLNCKGCKNYKSNNSSYNNNQCEDSDY